VLYGLGTTIGAGIYALTGVVAGRAGMHAPVAFLLAASIALFSALSFAELSSRFPRAGGEAVYVREGFGRVDLQLVVGMLVVAAGLISAATVSVGFVGYLGAFIAVPKLVGVAGIVIALGVVVGWGVRASVVAAGLMTLLEVAGLFAVITYGAPHLAELPARASEILWLGPGAGAGVGAAAILAFYAFLGFEDMVNAAEEVTNVRRTLPAAILITLAVTASLYVVIATVAVLAVPPAELATSHAPLALVFERCGGSAALLGIIALFALLNGALIQVLKASRVLWGLADQGVLPAFLRKIHPRTRTPLVAVSIATGVTGMLAAALPLETLAEATSIVTLATFALANLALVRIKRRDPSPAEAAVFPIWVPVVGFVLSCGLIVLDLVNRTRGA
jgi:APA family basic amino acid/polyamine antiporter